MEKRAIGGECAEDGTLSRSGPLQHRRENPTKRIAVLRCAKEEASHTFSRFARRVTRILIKPRGISIGDKVARPFRHQDEVSFRVPMLVLLIASRSQFCRELLKARDGMRRQLTGRREIEIIEGLQVGRFKGANVHHKTIHSPHQPPLSPLPPTVFRPTYHDFVSPLTSTLEFFTMLVWESSDRASIIKMRSQYGDTPPGEIPLIMRHSG